MNRTLKNNPIEFSLIFACFNEEDGLESAIKESIRILKRFFKSFEIIIIEDASRDKSPRIANKLARQSKFVKVIHNPINLGQGVSFLIGLKEAKGNLVMQNGVDMPFAMSDLKKVLPLFPRFDVVIVERKNREAYTLWRKFTSLANIFLRTLFFGRSFSDLNFVQIYKSRVIKSIPLKSHSAAFVTQELVLQAREKGYKIAAIKLPYYRRKTGEAHHGKQRDILWALIDMLSFWLEMH